MADLRLCDHTNFPGGCDGRVVCASRVALGQDDATWIKDAIGARDFAVGRYATAPAR